MIRSCRRCSTRFVPIADWAHYCKPCGRKRRQILDAFDEGVRLLPSGINDSDDEQPVDAIPPDMLRRLVQLCHPDRHGNSQAAQNATQWLLEQREGCQ